MPKINKYILSTDFATLANDTKADMSIQIPDSGTTNAGGETILAQQTVTVGRAGSPLRVLLETSSDPGNWLPVEAMSLDVASPQVRVFCYRSSASEVTLAAKAYTNTATSYSGIGQTISAKVATFVPPWQNS